MPVSYTRTHDIVILGIDHKPVNALSLSVRQALYTALQRAFTDGEIRGVVMTGSDAGFISGADINEFGTAAHAQEPRIKSIQTLIERSSKPVVAALNGSALGGGLEIALACHDRVAAPQAKIGLPEVKLGLLPGAGGTVRATRLCGPVLALDILTSGEHLSAQRALQLGLISEICDDVVAGACRLATRYADDGVPIPIISRDDKIHNISSEALAKARASALRRARGAIAPQKIIACVEAATRLDGADALAFEADAFHELLGGPQNKALQYAFKAERRARKPPTAASTAPEIHRGAVIGAGLMGGGIAMAFANAGIPVRIVDVSADALDRGRSAIEQNYNKSVERGALAQSQAEHAFSLIETTTDYGALSNADIAVEAVFEDLDLKRTIFSKLDEVLPGGATLATNTSSLDIDAIAAATKRPESVVGAHFFSPANVMKLLEVVRGAQTSSATIATIFHLAKRINKLPVLVGNCDGFVGNRMLHYYSTEAEFMLEEGATPEQVDRVAEAFGMAMGPLAVRDLIGLDTSLYVRKIRRASLPTSERLPEIVEALVARGRHGQKNAFGYYRYNKNSRLTDPDAIAIIEQSSKAKGAKRRTFSDDEIRDRLFMPLTNEGVRILEEGIAGRVGDIDTIWLNGYGFPAHRGGPMYWGEEAGLASIVTMAERLAAKNGPRWGPSAALRRLARDGARLASLEPQQ